MQQLTERQTVQGEEVERGGGSCKAGSRATLTWRVVNTRTDRWQDRQTQEERGLREGERSSGEKGYKERERETEEGRERKRQRFERQSRRLN